MRSRRSGETCSGDAAGTTAFPGFVFAQGTILLKT
eukprot:gene9954-11621_t